MRTLIDTAKAANVKVVFIQQEFDHEHAQQLAKEIGATVFVINPLDKNWHKQMIYIAQCLALKNGYTNE